MIAVNTDSDSLIVCNGYKDESYIELALLAQKMGKRIFLVVEKMNELKLIAKMAKQLNVQPNIGIRIKLASSGSGKWEESGGDASKFGLTSSEFSKHSISWKARLERLPEIDSFSYRQSGDEDPSHQDGFARGFTVLRAAPFNGVQGGIC